MSVLKDMFCAIVLAALTGASANADVPFVRTEESTPVTIGARRRQTPRTFIYAETVGSYSLFQNFLHRWLDRPLFFDRTLRHAPGAFEYDNKESFLRSRDAALRYGLDGFGVFGNYRGRLGRFNQVKEWNGDNDGFATFPLVFYTLSGDDFVASGEDIANMIKAASATPVATTCDGRKLMGTYNMRATDAATQGKLCASVRTLAAGERYVFPGELQESVLRRLSLQLRRNGRLDDGEIRELEKLVDDTLAVTDGLHLRVLEYNRPADGPYTSYIDQNLLDGCLKDILLAAYAKPQNSGKTLGFNVMQGYLNNLSGMNHGEFGTATLRRCMASVLALNPDCLLLFEWNEENENTMFQPTVRNGQSIGRLLHWYANLLRGQPVSSYKGDDNAVPNLVLSYRVVFKPGERIEFEMLNIPSGEKSPTHDVRLILRDGAGRDLVKFPQETIRTDRLGAVTYAVPGEKLPLDGPIIPSLAVDGVEHAGFHPMRQDATRCVDFKCVRQSLRDLPQVAVRDFTVKPSVAQGDFEFSVDMDCSEELMSVELVCNEDEVSAFDLANEYDRKKFDILRLFMYTGPGSSFVAPLEVEVTGTSGVRLRQEWKANVNPGRVQERAPGVFSLRSQWGANEVPYFLMIPRGTASQTTVRISSDALMGKGTNAVLPVAVAMARGSFESAPDAKRGFRIVLQKFDALPDVPMPIRARAVSWKGKVHVDDAAPMFHVRAITVGGKIWRSKAIAPVMQDWTRRERLAIYSEWKGGADDVEVPSALIPDIQYDFAPAAGASVTASGNHRHNASLGGGYVYGGMFADKRAFRNTVEGFANAPQWVKEDGRWMLRFDGENDYMHAPNETFPVGAFTLTAEFRPRYGEENMVLFRHAGLGRGSLQLFIVKGRLYAMWADRAFDDPKRRTAKFDTGLEISNGEWNTIVVSYDFRTLMFEVNGKRRDYPFDRRGYIFHPAVFGGHVITTDIAPPGPLAWFKGDLREFAIRHNGSCVRERAKQ